jgi:hypothetical protein
LDGIHRRLGCEVHELVATDGLVPDIA